MQTTKKITVVMPVYNDAGNIKKNITRVLKEFELLNYDMQLIVVNDGSTDETADILQGMHHEARFDYVSYYCIQGKGYAFLEGVNRAKGEYILLMDSDLQIGIHELPTFFKMIDLFQADVVIGNKRHSYSMTYYTFTRRVVSNVYNYICRVFFGIQLRDTQCGFKLFKKEAIDKVKDKIRTKRFAFDLELLIALRENRFRVADAPIYMAEQTNAGSVSISSIWCTLIDTIRIWIRKKEGYYGTPRN